MPVYFVACRGFLRPFPHGTTSDPSMRPRVAEHFRYEETAGSLVTNQGRNAASSEMPQPARGHGLLKRPIELAKRDYDFQ
jgi:hypothetical protein